MKHLKKKRILAAVFVLLIIIIALGVFYISKKSYVTPNTYNEAIDTPVVSKCLVEGNAINISADERSSIEMSAITYLIDVPAGTNVDVKLATYSKDKITGSDRYPAEYGNYNFTMDKQGDNWVVSEFYRCE